MMNSGKFHRSFITRKKLGWALAVLGFGLPIVGHGTDDSATGIAYPEGFRKWTHITTMVVGASSPFFQTSGGIHHVYANERAMQGYAAGEFPDGSILVFDLHDTKEKDGVTSEGPRQRIDVMVKDSVHFAATGGWAFERFMGESRTDRPLTEEHRRACFACHEQRKEHDFVFSQYHD